MLEGKPLFPGKDRKFILRPMLIVDLARDFGFHGLETNSSHLSTYHTAADVNQFSIITELLGTPPDDVIKTIGSENVCYTGESRSHAQSDAAPDTANHRLRSCSIVDPALCPVASQEREDPFVDKVPELGPRG